MAAVPALRAANARAAAAPAVSMSAADDGMPVRRAFIRAGAAAASTAFLAQLPALAADSDWFETEDGDWYNEVTGESSPTDPRKKAKAKKSKAKAAPAADEEVAAAPAKGEGKAEGMPKVSKMSGQISQYKDINKGFSIMKPNGWNQFDTAPGEYDVKWEDLVEKSELVMVGSSPVKSASSVDALGDIDAVGASLAKKKKASLVDAKTNTKDGILFYTFVFKAGDDKKGAREVYQLCVNKGKLWSVTATTTEKRWGKRKDLYGAIMASFAPKL
eukprot:Tamp_22670.p1 GENE.Tamp_22670~~Tamp_22670.p1  ORF type:complete len:313 (-),score=99.42 Tamp_22670:136-954(-)